MNKEQQAIIDYNGHTRIIAGAGCGKTYTLVLKINNLINIHEVLPKNILVISFTNNSVNDIKAKINANVDVFTFHKLALNILDKCNYNYNLINDNYLNYIINEYLTTICLKKQRSILRYVHFPKSYTSFLKSKEATSFKRLIYKYINLIKANGTSLIKSNFNNLNHREKEILLIILDIYKVYLLEKKSTNSLDLDDLIIYATNLIKPTTIKYKYIIIDEFQDTSMIRFKLIWAVLKHTKAKLIVVGDDWQSIYRFSGCDLNLFLNLPSYIFNIKTFKLEQNYRNSNEILQISKRFIEKNKFQITKNLYSNINILNPIRLISYTSSKESLKPILDYFIDKNLNVTILSRNSHDIEAYINEEIFFIDKVIKYREKEFNYMTIHKSKGLEFDNVILLNCNDDVMGLPNKIEDGNIIEKIYKNTEIKFAEERRLFYVALTRTKNIIFLLYNRNSPSIFIKELKKLIKKPSWLLNDYQ